jgi:outer membrane protein
MLRKILFLLMLSISGMLYAQQLTRFAVVDLPKVYMAFFQDSRAVREFEERVARVQNEVDRMTREINELRARQIEASIRGDQNEASQLETQVFRRTELLRDYYNTNTAILENIRKNLMQSGSFLDQVYDEIRYIAESEGYSLVLNLKENEVIIWYSATVDITDRLIANLRRN